MDQGRCTICPRNCGADRRKGPAGYCRTGDGMNVASVCIHRGEEPVISGEKGICNVFFAGCNMRCIYCQNHDISRGGLKVAGIMNDKEDVLDSICRILDTGIGAVGFVSPSHMIVQMLAIIEGLAARGFRPVTVFNTGSYDKVETIRMLDGIIDVYLPDFKYADEALAREFSDAPGYPGTALAALKEMYFQKGSVLRTDESGQAENGMLIRHLVLPGHTENSLRVLQTIADEISTGVHISLMSQYHPSGEFRGHPELRRTLYKREYESVAEEMQRLGFRNGYLQDVESNLNYRPDFRKDNPFE
jgi:putative pyruvate formate lyase activating enzyme